MGTIKFILKTLFVGTLIYVLVIKGYVSISLDDFRSALSQWDKTLPAFVAMVLSVLICVLRWQLLLRAQKIHISWTRTLELTLIGNFFSVALPGAVSGDFVKAFYIGRELEGKRARAFGSIVFDRVSGLSALVLVAAGALLLGFSAFWGTKLFVAIEFLIVFAALAVVAFYGYLFLVHDHRDPFLKLLRALERRFDGSATASRRGRALGRGMGSTLRIYESLKHYHAHRATVFKILCLSIMNHLLVGWACLNFAHALGESGLVLLPIYVIVPLGMLVTAIPITPAGVGTGHAAFFYLFKLVGSARGADVFTFVALVNILIGSIGGLVYLRFRGNPALAPVKAG